MGIRNWIIQVNGSDTGADIVAPPPDEPNALRSAMFPSFWTNQSIQVLQSNAITTSPTVGTPATIQARFFGGQERPESIVTVIQCWVCYPNTIPGGQFNNSVVVPSMRSGTATTLPTYSTPKPAIAIVAGFSGWVQLEPPWTPQPTDILSGAKFAHCCLLVNSFGAQGGVNVGTAPAADNDPAGVDPIFNPHVGQLNMSIIGLPQPPPPRPSPPPPGGGSGPAGGFPFLSGVGDDRGAPPIEVKVTHASQGGAIDPAVLDALKNSPYSGLPLHAGKVPPRAYGLTKNPESLEHGWLCQFFEEIREELTEVVDDIKAFLMDLHVAHDKKPQPSMTVRPPRSGIYPMLLHVQLDPTETNGAVHVFDIVQTETASGAKGGIRVVAVVT